MSSNKKSPRKKFIADLTDEDLYSDTPPAADDAHVDKPTVDVDAPIDKPTIDVDTPIDKPTVDVDTHVDKPTVDVDTHVDKPTIDVDTHVDKPTVDVDTHVDKPTVDVDTHVHDETRRKTFHSKKFADVDDSSADKPEVKRKISHAEASGILISVVMLGYSLVTEDKPLFFLSTALLIFLLRPIIGGLFGKHSQTIQNGLHAFSIALFVGALVFLFM